MEALYERFPVHVNEFRKMLSCSRRVAVGLYNLTSSKMRNTSTLESSFLIRVIVSSMLESVTFTIVREYKDEVSNQPG
jgi:hypothetical protein